MTVTILPLSSALFGPARLLQETRFFLIPKAAVFKGLFTSIKKHMMFSSFYFGPLVCPSMSFRFSYLINKIVFALMEQLPTPL